MYNRHVCMTLLAIKSNVPTYLHRRLELKWMTIQAFGVYTPPGTTSAILMLGIRKQRSVCVSGTPKIFIFILPLSLLI